jgi:hypothetical protein
VYRKSAAIACVAALLFPGIPFAADISFCNRLIRASAFDINTKFKLADGSEISRSDYCNRVTQGTAGNLTVIGYGDGALDSKQAQESCGDTFLHKSQSDIEKEYNQKFPQRLLDAYKICAESLTKFGDELFIDPTSTVNWVPGSSASKDEYAFPHYDYTIYFRWISPDPARLPSTTATLNINNPFQMQRTHCSWGHETASPPPAPKLDDDCLNGPISCRRASGF